MQADVALHLLPRDAGRARPALEAVSQTSAQALEELRSTLRMVRGAPAARTPTPGLADLDSLYARMGEAGVRVHVRTTGTPGTLPPADLAAYRVVQESLTNVLKHAAVKRADIAIDHRPAVGVGARAGVFPTITGEVASPRLRCGCGSRS